MEKKKAKPREAERDYSHRLLIDKLGVKPGHRAAVIGVESAEFLSQLSERVPDFSAGKLIRDLDLIFFSAEDVKGFAHLEKIKSFMRNSGAIWVVYPKGQKHIREIDVIAAAKSAGLVDNKVCSFSSTHTALRLCIPRDKR